MGNQCCGSPSNGIRDSSSLELSNSSNNNNIILNSSHQQRKPSMLSPKADNLLLVGKQEEDYDRQSETTEPSCDGGSSTDDYHNSQVHDQVETIYLLVDQVTREAGQFALRSASSAFSVARSGSSSRSSWSDAARETRGERTTRDDWYSRSHHVGGGGGGCQRDDIEDEVDAARSTESQGRDVQQSERSTTNTTVGA